MADFVSVAESIDLAHIEGNDRPLAQQLVQLAFPLIALAYRQRSPAVGDWLAERHFSDGVGSHTNLAHASQVIIIPIL